MHRVDQYKNDVFIIYKTFLLILRSNIKLFNINIKIKIMKNLISLLPIILFISCQKEPTSIISVNKTEVEVNEQLSFTNNSTDADSYEWSFGDGNTSNDDNPVYAWNKPGNYTVVLTSFSKNMKKNDKDFVNIDVVDINKKFEGHYIMDGECSDYEIYILSITTIGSNGLKIENFGGVDILNFNATVSGNTLTIPKQTKSDDWGDYTFTGTGSLNGNNLLLNMEIKYVDWDDPDWDWEYNCSEFGSK